MRPCLFIIPPKKLNAKEHGDVFFCYALLRRSDAYEEHGDVFFCCMPFT